MDGAGGAEVSGSPHLARPPVSEQSVGCSWAAAVSPMEFPACHRPLPRDTGSPRTLSPQMPAIPWPVLSFIKTATFVALAPSSLRNGRSVRRYFLAREDITMKSAGHRPSAGSSRPPGPAPAAAHNRAAVLSAT